MVFGMHYPKVRQAEIRQFRINSIAHAQPCTVLIKAQSKKRQQKL